MPSRVAPPASLSAVRRPIKEVTDEAERPIKEVTDEAERFVREGSPVLQLHFNLVV